MMALLLLKRKKKLPKNASHPHLVGFLILGFFFSLKKKDLKKEWNAGNVVQSIDNVRMS